MTHQDYFRTTSLRRWYAIGGHATPYRVPMADGSELIGCRLMAMMDVESQTILKASAVERPPGAITAGDILGFISDVAKDHGMPTQGVLISPTIWKSSEDLRYDPELNARAEKAAYYGFQWPEMASTERSRIELQLGSLGLRVAWTEPEIPNWESLFGKRTG